ncbi:HAD family hydrolase [Marinomonas epiphytica]
MELVAFDLDGTLLNSQQRLSDYTIETLQKMDAAGIFYTIATGRTHQAAMPCIANHAFKNTQIFKNGVEWWSPNTQSYQYHSLLKPEQLTQVLGYFEEQKVTPFIFCIENDGQQGVYHPKVQGHLCDHIANELGNHDKMDLRPIEEMPKTARITNISAMGLPTSVERIVAYSEQHLHLSAYSGGGIYNPDAYWLDIHHSDACKGSALIKLKQEVGADQLVVFGDGDNDLSMFALADQSYAMGNALDRVKEKAHEVIGHHDDNAVAKLLRDRYNL